MKYLVTGGAGFIGSNLTNKLIGEGHEVIVIDDLSMGKIENFNDFSKVSFIKGSISDTDLMEKILLKNSFDYIFHLAAIASVADSVERPIETHEVNYNAVLTILDLVRKYQKNLKRFVFASSAAVYGDDPELPKKETSPIKPMTQYAVDKYAAERTTINFFHLYNVPTSAVRFFNVYGPNQNPESPYSGVISILVDRFDRYLKQEEIGFTLFGDGNQSRDFIYIDDVLNALLLIAGSNNSLGQVYNVGTGIETSLNKVINVMDNIYQTKLPITNEVARTGDIKKSQAQITSLESLGFCPSNDISQGLMKLIRFTSRH